MLDCFRVVSTPRSPIRLAMRTSYFAQGDSLQEPLIVVYSQHATSSTCDEHSFSNQDVDRDSEPKFRKKSANCGKKFLGASDALSDDWIKPPCCQGYVAEGWLSGCRSRIPLAWISHVVKYPTDPSSWDFWPSKSPRTPASKGALPRCLN